MYMYIYSHLTYACTPQARVRPLLTFERSIYIHIYIHIYIDIYVPILPSYIRMHTSGARAAAAHQKRSIYIYI